MGMFDFVKNAGRKLGMWKAEGAQAMPDATAKMEAAKRAATAAAGGDTVALAAWMENDILAAIAAHGVGIEQLKARVKGETVTLEGRARNRADAEKAVLIAGNTEGIAKVEDLLSVAATEPAASFYTVVKGDTLSKIAKVQYGDAQAYGAIFEANRPMLTHPDRIYPGQVLRIPARSTAQV